MEKIISKSGAPEFDLSLWREFQDALSALLDIPLSLYNGKGALLVPPSGEPAVCSAVRSTRSGNAGCGDICSKAIGQVVENGQVYIYKCHVNKYIFAVPVKLDSGSSYVIIGGKTYLSGSEFREFYEGIASLPLDTPTIAKLRDGIKTVPPRSIFSIPNIVKNLAVPFLKGLSSAKPRGSSLIEDDKYLKSFQTLEKVYKALAPVLDREELYETILAKSSELVEAERGTLMILDNQNFLSVKAAKGIERSLIDNLKVKVGEGISGAIAAKGLPLMVKNIETEVPSRKNRPKYKTKSFISIPLKLDTRVIGVINVSDKLTGEVFSEEDLHLLLNFANYASIALERGAYYSMSEELKMLSMTDPLTGLFNRRYFRERLFEEVERVKRHDECFSTFLIDIDNFKSFNDRYGHIVGDEILKGVARSIRDAVRSMDVVARYGGEEFVVILPHTDKKDSTIIAERIRRYVEEYRPGSESFKEWPTISIGVAEFPQDAANIDELIHRADSAMYLAKKMGKNRVVIYEK